MCRGFSLNFHEHSPPWLAMVDRVGVLNKACHGEAARLVKDVARP